MDQQEPVLLPLLNYQGNQTSRGLLEDDSFGTYQDFDSETSSQHTTFRSGAVSEYTEDSNTHISDFTDTIQSLESDHFSDNTQTEEATTSAKEDAPKVFQTNYHFCSKT